MNDALRKPSLIRYGFFAMPLAFAGLPLYMHMPDLYAREFGLNLAVLGTVLLVIRLIDAVQDPVLGYVSDQYAHHRTTIMYIGTATLALGLAGLCFGPPTTTVTVLWFSGFMVLATTGYSVLTINLNFIGGFWKRDENHRITIASWREAFGLIGLLIAAIVPAVAQTRLTVMQSYMALFIVFGVLMGIGIVLIRNFLATTQLETGVGTNQERASFAFLLILTGKDRLFFAICFVSYIAASIPAILVLPFVRDYLDAEAMTGLFLALYFLSGAVFMGFWSKISHRLGPQKTWLVAHLVAILTFVGAAGLGMGDTTGFAIVCVASGMALGADLLFPPALLAAHIRKQNHEATATQYYAALAFLPKAALAIAAGGTFIMLDRVGFTAGASNTELQKTVLLILYAVVPCVLKTVSAGLLWHRMNKKGFKDEAMERDVYHGTTRNS